MSASPWAGRWFGVAVVAGVVAGLCLLVAVLLALVPVQVSAGDVSHSCGSAFSVDGARADDPPCAAAVDDRKAWVYGTGALVALFGSIAIGSVVAIAIVDPESDDLTDRTGVR